VFAALGRVSFSVKTSSIVCASMALPVAANARSMHCKWKRMLRACVKSRETKKDKLSAAVTHRDAVVAHKRSQPRHGEASGVAGDASRPAHSPTARSGRRPYPPAVEVEVGGRFIGVGGPPK